MRQHAQLDLQVAAFPRSRPVLPLRRDADRGAVPRSRGDPDLDALLGFGHPASVACRAPPPSGAAGSPALPAHAGSRIPDLADRPPDHVEEVDGNLDPDVAPPGGMGEPRSPAAKRVAEKIPQVERLRPEPPGGVSRAAERSGAMETARESPLADRVVLFPLLPVAKDLVGLVCFLEARLGRLVAGVDVGVVLLRQPPERLPDLLRRGAFRDPQDPVIVLLRVHPRRHFTATVICFGFACSRFPRRTSRMPSFISARTLSASTEPGSEKDRWKAP